MPLTYYTPKYFAIQELVDPETYKALGNDSLLVMDYRILKTIDAIREFFGLPCIINNWHMGKDRFYSGYRPPTCMIGAVYSQHRFGRAVDMVIPGVSPEDARIRILNAPNCFPYITCIEDKVNWLHIDCRSVIGVGIQLIQP